MLQALLTVNDESMYLKMNLANQMMASRGLVPQGRWLGYMMTAHMLEGDLAVSPKDPAVLPRLAGCSCCCVCTSISRPLSLS